MAVCSGVTRPTTDGCLHRKSPLGAAAMEGQDGGGVCIGRKHCGDCVRAHIACSWALIAGGASGWLPLLSGAAANLALFGLSPLCQHTLNSGANAEMEELCFSPISCLFYWGLLPSCETVLSPSPAKVPVLAGLQQSALLSSIGQLGGDHGEGWPPRLRAWQSNLLCVSEWQKSATQSFLRYYHRPLE